MKLLLNLLEEKEWLILNGNMKRDKEKKMTFIGKGETLSSSSDIKMLRMESA